MNAGFKVAYDVQFEILVKGQVGNTSTLAAGDCLRRDAQP
jgi:hypothetical protein